MGMFDDVKCERVMPGDRQPRSCQFQTKDFACEMSGYEITSDGRLLKDGEPHYFHGHLNFYTHESDDNTGRGGGWWFEYDAKFTDGRLVEIRAIDIHHSKFGEREPDIVVYPLPHHQP